MPRAARSFSSAAPIHEAIEPDPESRDHGLHLTQQKYVAARRTRRERARGVRPFDSRHFSREMYLGGHARQVVRGGPGPEFKNSGRGSFCNMWSPQKRGSGCESDISDLIHAILLYKCENSDMTDSDKTIASQRATTRFATTCATCIFCPRRYPRR